MKQLFDTESFVYRMYDLVPIAAEDYGDMSASFKVVAAARKRDLYMTLFNLKSKLQLMFKNTVQLRQCVLDNCPNFTQNIHDLKTYYWTNLSILKKGQICFSLFNLQKKVWPVKIELFSKKKCSCLLAVYRTSILIYKTNISCVYIHVI